jgi:hypothetical protein
VRILNLFPAIIICFAELAMLRSLLGLYLAVLVWHSSLLPQASAVRNWTHTLFENPETAFGRVCPEYHVDTFIAAAKRPDVCTGVLIGAPWDGHFKRYVAMGTWLKIHKDIEESLPPFIAETNVAPFEVELGYMFYHTHYNSSISAPQQLPDDIPGAWTRNDVGSYLVRFFRNGAALRDKLLEGKARNAHFAPGIGADILNLCASSVAFSEL